MNCDEVTQIDKSLIVDAFECQHQNLELYAQFHWQPVKFEEQGSQLIMVISAYYDPGADIPYSLKLADQSLRQAIQQAVAGVQVGQNRCMGKSLGAVHIEITSDASNTVQLVKGTATETVYVLLKRHSTLEYDTQIACTLCWLNDGISNSSRESAWCADLGSMIRSSIFSSLKLSMLAHPATH